MATEPKAGVSGNARINEAEAASHGDEGRNIDLGDVSADPFAEQTGLKETDSDLARAIQAGADQLAMREKPLLQPEAEALVRADLWIMARISDPQARHSAAASLGDAGANHATYKAELLKQSPSVAAEVELAEAEDQRRSEAKDLRKSDEFAAHEAGQIAKAAGWSDAQAKLQAAQDLETLKDFPSDADYQRKDMERNASANPIYRVELDRLEARNKVNTLEPSIEKEQQILTGADADKRNAWLNKAKAPEPVTSTTPVAQNHLDSDEIFTATQPDIKPLVPVEVAQQYTKVGDKFHYKPAGTELAFQDKGNRLETRSDSEQVAESLVRIAEARGWDEIKVAGTETFRKEVWMEAASRGMHIKGYTPSEQDKAELAKRSNDSTLTGSSVNGATFRGREILAQPASPVAESKSQAMANSFANESAVDAVRKHPELAGAVAATAAIEKRAQADGLTSEQQQVLKARVRQNIMNSIEAGTLPKPIEIREETEKQAEVENHREVSR